MIARFKTSFGPADTSPDRVGADPRTTRPLYWSVRRELWEHRALYVAPLAAAGAVLLGFLLSTFRLPHALRAIAAGEAKRIDRLMTPYDVAAIAVMATALLAAMFYAMAALHGERRDRGILFWKSLPVSDLTTVLSKAAVPILVVPVLTLAIILATQVVMLVCSTLVVVANGLSPTLLWSHIDLSLMWVTLPYGLIVNAAWMTPVFAWFLLVSVWARRMPALWALAPFLGAALVEWLSRRTSHIGHFIVERLLGGFGAAFSLNGEGKAPIERLDQLQPLRVLALPDIWIGLIFAAAFLAAAVWLRRRREPM